MTRSILAILLSAIFILGVARFTPGVRIRGYGTALGVAVVYSLLSFLLKSILVFLTFPLIIVSFGLFLLVINAFLLWLTDKLIDGLEIDGFGPLAVATVGVTASGVLVNWILW